MSPGRGEKPPWQIFIESNGGAALITAILAGIVAQCVTGSIQRHAEQREFNNAWLKARGDQALSAYKEYRTEQLQAAEKIYTTVGRVVAASEALIAAADWDRSKPSTDAYVHQIAMQFNDSEDEWVKAKPHFAFAMSYYADPDVATDKDWIGVDKAVDAYLKCVSTWYGQPSTDHFPPEMICAVQKAEVQRQLNGLTKDLAQSGTKPWRGWDNPDAMRKKLHLPPDS